MTYLLKHTSIEEHEIPEIQLYMDQVLEFFEQNLSPLKRSADDPIFTKTMINNYVKAKVIDAPLKKKYSKEAIKDLIMVYAFKQVLSIQDTNLLLKALHQTGENPYNAFKNAESSVIEALNKQILDESERFKDMDSDDLTEKLTLILKLTLDAALKKRLAEQLLDQLSSSDSK